MIEWKAIRVRYNHEVLDWWEGLVKPSIRKIAIDFTRTMKKDNKEYLNCLYLKQTYFHNKIIEGNKEAHLKYKTVNMEITDWFKDEAKQLQLLINLKDLTESENTNLYHHALHKKKITNSAILELDTEEGILRGHQECTKYIEKSVRNLLTIPYDFDLEAQETLLKELDIVFTEEDNAMLLETPSSEEIHSVLRASNLNAAPGSDGITGLLYATLYDVLGDSLEEVIRKIFCIKLPTPSQ